MKITTIPKVSVIMPVYNGSLYIRNSIESILAQTFDDFEFIIVDDHSSDNSQEIIKTYKDSRITLLCKKTNSGISTALNAGMEQSVGKYIAIMHCDDVSFPTRLEKQLAFLDSHPQIGVCGTFAQKMGVNRQKLTYATESDDIKAMLLFRSAFCHPTVMLRKDVFPAFNLTYDCGYRYMEDYELWCQLLKLTEFANLPEVLLHYRVHADQAGTNTKRQHEAKKIRLSQLNALGIVPTDQELDLHQMLGEGTYITSRRFAEAVANWFAKLTAANSKRDYYRHSALTKLLAAFTAEHIWYYQA